MPKTATPETWAQSSGEGGGVCQKFATGQRKRLPYLGLLVAVSCYRIFATVIYGHFETFDLL